MTDNLSIFKCEKIFFIPDLGPKLGILNGRVSSLKISDKYLSDEGLPKIGTYPQTLFLERGGAPHPPIIVMHLLYICFYYRCTTQ